jgi:hypothetical protein
MNVILNNVLVALLTIKVHLVKTDESNLILNIFKSYFLRFIHSHSGLSLSSDTNIHLPLNVAQK